MFQVFNKLFYGKNRTPIHASVLNVLLLKINIFQEWLPCGLVCLVFSQGWGLKEAEKTTPRIHKKIAHFFPGSWFHLSGEEALSLLSAGSKSATLSPPLRQKESGKKSLIAIMRSQEGYWIVLSRRQIWRHSKRKRISCLYHRKAVPAFTINSRFDTVIIFDYEHVEYMTRHLPCSRLEHMRRQQ